MTTAPFTNYAISAAHLANFRADARRAESESDLRSLAEKHALYWLAKDAAEARSVYAQHRKRIRGQT
jgi:hypothetical protein